MSLLKRLETGTPPAAPRPVVTPPVRQAPVQAGVPATPAPPAPVLAPPSPPLSPQVSPAGGLRVPGAGNGQLTEAQKSLKQRVKMKLISELDPSMDTTKTDE